MFTLLNSESSSEVTGMDDSDGVQPGTAENSSVPSGFHLS